MDVMENQRGLTPSRARERKMDVKLTDLEEPVEMWGRQTTILDEANKGTEMRMGVQAHDVIPGNLRDQSPEYYGVEFLNADGFTGGLLHISADDADVLAKVRS